MISGRTSVVGEVPPVSLRSASHRREIIEHAAGRLPTQSACRTPTELPTHRKIQKFKSSNKACAVLAFPPADDADRGTAKCPWRSKPPTRYVRKPPNARPGVRRRRPYVASVGCSGRSVICPA